MDGDAVYLCNALADADEVEIDLPFYPELEGITLRRSPAKVHALARLSDDVVELTIRLPPSVDFRYLPGQFIRLSTPQGVERSYSLANAPGDDRLLRLQVRLHPGGTFSDYLAHRAACGDLLHLVGPHGHFFLRGMTASTVRATVFLATGTGIAPIHAMVQGLTAGKREGLGEVTLYWGNRTRSDAYLADRIADLARQHGIRYVPVYSREPDQPFRHVQEAMSADYPDLAGTQVYACGNVGMIRAANVIARARGLRADRFYSDPFTQS